MVLRYTESQAREAIAVSLSYAESLRPLGMCWTGRNYVTLRKWAEIWEIPTGHFDPDAARRKALRRTPVPLDEVLVTGSSNSRGKLKERLYDAGLKARRCELCGQGEIWRDRRMALILDHVNGDPLDNRLENLRIVCPNCAATLDTHCGRKHARPAEQRACKRCGKMFEPKSARQAYCSRDSGQRSARAGRPIPGARRVERPPYEELVAEVAATSWRAVGRKYGVSDIAIRKWVRDYERERAAVELAGASVEPDGAAGVGVPGPVGPAGAEVDAAEPAVDRRAGGRAVEDADALGRERVVPVGARDQRLKVVGEGEHGGVAEPRWVFAFSHRRKQLVRVAGPGAERFEDLPLGAAQPGPDVWKLLQQAVQGGDLEPCAGIG
jgi:hypothetical protein